MVDHWSVGLDQGLDHWETVYALLEEETLNLFKDQDAASEVSGFTHTTLSHTHLLVWKSVSVALLVLCLPYICESTTMTTIRSKNIVLSVVDFVDCNYFSHYRTVHAGHRSLWLEPFVKTILFTGERSTLSNSCELWFMPTAVEWTSAHISVIYFHWALWFRLSDGSHYLFAASSQREQQKWLKELQECINPTVSSDSPG